MTPEPNTNPYGLDPSRASGFAFKLGRRWFVDLLQPYGERVRLKWCNGLYKGALVEVQIVPDDLHRGAEVLRIIDCESETERATKSVLALYQAPVEWSETQQLDFPHDEATDDAVANRSDMRNIPFVTIDGESARDFDDAVYARASAEGGYLLAVAIADVAHYVTPGSEWDAEARERGNSIYLPKIVVPMLPESLSNGICSLNPDVDRLAIVCNLRVDTDGTIREHEFHEAVIRSRARLTYTEVGSTGRIGLSGHSKSVRESVRALFAVRDLLRKRRVDRGAIDFDLPVTKVQVGKDGEPLGVASEERNEAHELIEEAMIAANVAAAEYLQRRGQRPIFRVHDKPDEEALKELLGDLRAVGMLAIPPLNDPKGVQRLLEELRRKRLMSRVWEMRVLRAMTQATYTPVNTGHFGLALPNYLHFTSPIRRYADLQVHRLIKQSIREHESSTELDEELKNIARHITMTERRAADIERRVDTWLKCALLKRKVNQIFSGTVSGIADFGVFVELDDYVVSGLLHVTSMPDDYYQNRGTAYVGQSSGVRYRLGDRVEVRLVLANPEAGRLDLMDVRRRSKPRRSAESRRRRR